MNLAKVLAPSAFAFAGVREGEERGRVRPDRGLLFEPRGLISGLPEFSWLCFAHQRPGEQ